MLKAFMLIDTRISLDSNPTKYQQSKSVQSLLFPVFAELPLALLQVVLARSDLCCALCRPLKVLCRPQLAQPLLEQPKRARRAWAVLGSRMRLPSRCARAATAAAISAAAAASTCMCIAATTAPAAAAAPTPSATPSATCLGGKSSSDCSCNLLLHFCGTHTASAVATAVASSTAASSTATAICALPRTSLVRTSLARTSLARTSLAHTSLPRLSPQAL